MLSRHDQTLLEELLAGVRERSDPEVLRRIEQSAEFAREFESLSRLQSGLEELGRAVPSDVSSAFRDTVAELPLPSADADTWRVPGGRSPMQRFLPLIALAAAASVLVWFVAGRLGGGGTPVEPGPPLGGEIEIELPGPTVQEAPVFRWNDTRTPGGWFEARLYHLDAAEPLFASGRLSTPEWKLDSDQSARLPDAYRIEVIVRSAGGDVEDSASRSSSP